MQVTITSHERYNGLGQKTNYVQTITSDITAVVQNDLWAQGKYNLLGQLQSFTQETRNRGPDYYLDQVLMRTPDAIQWFGQIGDMTEQSTSSMRRTNSPRNTPIISPTTRTAGKTVISKRTKQTGNPQIRRFRRWTITTITTRNSN